LHEMSTFPWKKSVISWIRIRVYNAIQRTPDPRKSGPHPSSSGCQRTPMDSAAATTLRQSWVGKFLVNFWHIVSLYLRFRAKGNCIREW
jgi:hypothetical protein